MRVLFILAAIVTAPIALSAQTNDIAIIPRPVSLTRGSGAFSLSARTQIFTDRSDSAVAERFARSVAAATGFALPVRIGRATSGNRVVFQRTAATDTTLGDEGYRLDVKPGVVTITSSAPGRRVLRHPDASASFFPPTFSATRPCAERDVDDPRRVDRGPSALCLARHAPRRVAPLHAEGVRQEVHRPPRAAQDEPLPLASHR